MYRLSVFSETSPIVDAKYLRIQGVKGAVLVRTVGQLDGVDEIANAILVRKADGYYLKVATFTDNGKVGRRPTNEREIGLDFGIKTTLTTSEGRKSTCRSEKAGVSSRCSINCSDRGKARTTVSGRFCGSAANTSG